MEGVTRTPSRDRTGAVLRGAVVVICYLIVFAGLLLSMLGAGAR